MATRQNSLERIWFIAVVVWSILRVIFADVFFAKYGINIWIFAGVEVISSPILARSTSKMAISLSRHHLRNSLIWGILTLVSFAAPDVYLLTTGKHLPWLAYLVVIAIMVIAGTISMIKMRRKAEELAQSGQ
ncbi:unannotated protein [freshwater metagenome]|uniref:Unannotated protein n=1 Tax=freshwater metagenome TaxID=449393 RepID=A0A6J7DSG2_9ZZZZ|nr:hypothetical protein [Actinomycetota bacterium]MSX36671.1 hypothetical protein [Actinomycetota bacterium]MSZ71037.1 hypothetical protein [Actinomycetota bacterium]MUH55552.1 hypothetical protein [Actinomycetota bacterium]